MSEKLLDRADQRMRVTDSEGNETGEIVRRADAHKAPGIKHLAFLVFVINEKNEFVLHRRIGKKVGDNAIDSIVSHVLENESLEQAVHRALKHEYGIEEELPLLNLGGFSYEKEYGDGTCENEYCLTLVVEYNGPFAPNSEEIDGGLIFAPVNQVIEEAKQDKEKFEAWFYYAVEIFESAAETAKFRE